MFTENYINRLNFFQHMVKKEKEPEKGEEGSGDRISDKERVDKGQLLVRIVVEVVGAPKEHVEEAVKLVVDRVHHQKDLDVVSESTFAAEEKGKLFSTFSEMEIWFKDTDVLTRFLFDFTPSSVEVMQPSTVPLTAHHFSGFLNDFLLKMHESGMKLKDLSAKTQLLSKNTDTLVRNFLNYALEKPRTTQQLPGILGIPMENIGAILENFEKAGIVTKEGDVYSLVSSEG
jgi:hypothetical protein